MGRAAFVARGRRGARGLPAMFDFDGKWNAKAAARGFAPCKLQYYLQLQASGKKSKKRKPPVNLVTGCRIPKVGHPLCSRVC
jgi:hypothetical protein